MSGWPLVRTPSLYTDHDCVAWSNPTEYLIPEPLPLVIASRYIQCEGLSIRSYCDIDYRRAVRHSPPANTYQLVHHERPAQGHCDSPFRSHSLRTTSILKLRGSNPCETAGKGPVQGRQAQLEQTESRQASSARPGRHEYETAGQPALTGGVPRRLAQ